MINSRYAGAYHGGDWNLMNPDLIRKMDFPGENPGPALLIKGNK